MRGRISPEGVAPDVRCGSCFPSLNQSNAPRTHRTSGTGASPSTWTCSLCQCHLSTSNLDLGGDDFIVPAIMQYLGVRSLARFGATCKAYRMAASMEVARRKERIATIEDEVTRILDDCDGTMGDDDKFYEAETLFYNTMRLIDDESSHSLLKMKVHSYVEIYHAYEWKWTDCFFQERKKIISLTDRRYSFDNTEVNLGGYEFCFTCGAACSDGECGCSVRICVGCDEYYESCTCTGIGWDNIGDFCINCGKRCCNCCWLGCTYRGDPAYGSDHLNHLPCCYNADESSCRYGDGTLWKGSMKCRARLAKKGITAKSLAERINMSDRSPNIRI